MHSTRAYFDDIPRWHKIGPVQGQIDKIGPVRGIKIDG